MLARLFRNAALGVVTTSALALAQDPTPPNPAPPATPQPTPPANPPAAPAPAPQGAPRHRSAAKLGESNVVVEHGQPTWNDQRLGQMAQSVPVGQVWRMGSEAMTTLSIAGGPVFFGEEMIEPGRYGFNLLRASETTWNFVVFQPKHEADGAFTMQGDEAVQQIPATYVDNATESAAVLTVDVIVDGDAARCVVAWGPIRVTAPISSVSVATSELEVNGTAAEASWYHRPLAPGVDLARPMIAGKLDMEIDGESCSMNVYVAQDGANLVALFRNAEREGWEKENATMEQTMKTFEALIQQVGAQAEAALAPRIQAMKRRLAKNEIMLEETVNRPDNLKYAEVAADASPGRISCDVVKTRGSLNLEIVFGGKHAVIRLDESQFALRSTN